MRTSGPLYLTIIHRPKTEVWYAKSKMGEHKLGSIMRTPCKNTNCRRKANFQSFHQKGCSRKTEESRTAKAQQEVQKHRRVRVNSLSVPPTSAVVVLPSNASPLSSAAAVPLPTHQTSFFISDTSVTFSQRSSSSTFQQLHCKYPKLLWAEINKPCQLFTSGISDR